MPERVFLVRAEWELDELIGAWALVEGDWELVGGKVGASRLGSALILKFCGIEGRFPACAEEVPQAAVGYVASLVEVDEEGLAQWLADKVCPVETNRDRLAEAVRERCRSTSVEPPASGPAGDGELQ